MGYPATIEYDLDIQDARPRLPGQSSCLPFKQKRQGQDSYVSLYRFYVGLKSGWFPSGYFGSVSLCQRDRTWSSKIMLLKCYNFYFEHRFTIIIQYDLVHTQRTLLT